MTGGQRIHDPIPDASLPPTNEAVCSKWVLGAIGFQADRPGGNLSARPKTHRSGPADPQHWECHALVRKERPDRSPFKVREFIPLQVWVLESCPNRCLSTGKTGDSGISEITPQSDMTRTCKIDANDPKRTSEASAA